MAMIDYAALFAQYDDPVKWEYPPGFDYSDAVRRFRAFVSELQSILETELVAETETHIQDASFHSQVYLHESLVRFSNFGEMVAITNEELLDAKTHEIVTELVRRSGYIYVPKEAFKGSYTGRNPGVTGIRDWWIRYFDWV